MTVVARGTWPVVSTDEMNINVSSDRSPEGLAVYITTLIILLLLSLWVLVSSTLIILVVSRHRKLQRKMYAFIVSLACADLFTAMTAPVGWFVQERAPQLVNTRTACGAVYSVITVPMMVTLWGWLMVACDRYIAVMHPLHYNRIVTPDRIKLAITISWLYAVAISASLCVWNKWEFDPGQLPVCDKFILPTYYILLVLVPHWVICDFLMLFIYACIFRVAKMHQSRVQPGVNETSAENNFDTIRRKEAKAARLVSMTLGAFLICWTPLEIDISLSAVGINSLASDILFTVAYANSGVNFIVYALANSSRSALRQLFGIYRTDAETSHRHTINTGS